MLLLLGTFAFVFGTIIGSFMNAVLWRLRTRESIVVGRSHCTCCGHTLAPRDLIPVVSFLLLGGKCRYCRAGIHPSYVIVELTMGALFALFASSALVGGMMSNVGLVLLLRNWYFAAALVLIFVYDLRYMLIPRQLTVVPTILAMAAALAMGVGPGSLLLAMAVGAGIFWLQYVISKGQWVGGGDIHLGALMGAMLGWPQVLVALFLAYMSGALYGVVLLLTKRTTWKSQLPFGTFLSAATIVTLLWGGPILHWYLQLTF